MFPKFTRLRTCYLDTDYVVYSDRGDVAAKVPGRVSRANLIRAASFTSYDYRRLPTELAGACNADLL